jgi:hypothetical protein
MDAYITEKKALAMLMRHDFTESQARIVLGHSLQQTWDGMTYYPLFYILKRAKANSESISAMMDREENT